MASAHVSLCLQPGVSTAGSAGVDRMLRADLKTVDLKHHIASMEWVEEAGADRRSHPVWLHAAVPPGVELQAALRERLHRAHSRAHTPDPQSLPVAAAAAATTVDDRNQRVCAPPMPATTVPMQMMLVCNFDGHVCSASAVAHCWTVQQH